MKVFIILFMALWFIQLAVQTAGKNIALSGAPDINTQLAVIMNLRGSLTIPLLCFLGFGVACWGLILTKLEGKNKAVGFLYFLAALFCLLFVLFLLIGNVLIANIMNLINIIAFIIIHILIGFIIIPLLD